MFLASKPSHVPAAVFNRIADAEACLGSVHDVALGRACSEPLAANSDMFKVYTTKKILGYILIGVKINSNYVV